LRIEDLITVLFLDTGLPTQNALCLQYKGLAGVTGVLMKQSRHKLSFTCKREDSRGVAEHWWPV